MYVFRVIIELWGGGGFFTFMRNFLTKKFEKVNFRPCKGHYIQIQSKIK